MHDYLKNPKHHGKKKANVSSLLKSRMKKDPFQLVLSNFSLFNSGPRLANNTLLWGMGLKFTFLADRIVRLFGGKLLAYE